MNRRELITGLISLVAAPAIVRAGSLMPIKGVSLNDGVRLISMSHPNHTRVVIKGWDEYGTVMTETIWVPEGRMPIAYAADHTSLSRAMWFRVGSINVLNDPYEV